jgi:epoxyqueuosine reductase
MSDRGNGDILHNQEPLSPLPMERIRRVDRPTTLWTETIGRIDMRDTAYGLARRGEYGPAVQRGVQNSLPGKYPLSAAQKDVMDHLALVPGNPVGSEIAPVPQDPGILTRHLKAVGYFLKADLVGACRVPESAYYSHDQEGKPIEARYENALVLVMRKEAKAMRASTGSDWIGDPISFQAYEHLGLVAETVANYVRRLGWDASAQYGPSFVNRYAVLLPPLLLLAGIGEVSRAGIILNPYLGLGFKAAAVLTDMPLLPDRPLDFGLQSFCQSCRICAQACPSQAIPRGDKVIYNGYETWKLNTKRCASFNFTNKTGTMCNRCVKSCPWTNPPTRAHNLVRSLVSRSRPAQRIAIRAAALLEPGKHYPAEQWWFNMEYVDGVIRSGITD